MTLPEAGQVTQADLKTIKEDKGMTAENSNYNFDADVNRDGVINGQDLKLAKEDLGASTAVSPVVSVNLDPASNPELDGTTPYSSVDVRGQCDAGRDHHASSIRQRAYHDDDGRGQDRHLQHHGAARDRIEHVHGDDHGRVWAVDHWCDHAGGLFAVGFDGTDLQLTSPAVDSTMTVSTCGPWGEITPHGLRSFGMNHPCVFQGAPSESATRGSGSSRCRSRAASASLVPIRPRAHAAEARTEGSSEQSSRRADREDRSPRSTAGPEHEGCIAQEPGAFGTCQGRSLERGFPFGGAHRQPFDQVGIGPLRAGVELRFTTGRGLAVPGTYVLADVAAKDPAIERGRLVIGEHASVLDRPVTDTAPGVELIRADEGLGWTGVKAARAGSAVVRVVRRVVSQLGVDQERAQEREAAQAAADEHGILADPADSRQPREITFEQRGGIDHRPASYRWALVAKPRQEGLELVPEHAVVITRLGRSEPPFRCVDGGRLGFRSRCARKRC